MPDYRFSDALNYTHEQLSQMFNESFTGYFFPMNSTAQQNADFWRTEQLDSARSVVMHDEAGIFVGLARIGVRGRRGWCGGFGIVPKFRGTGASKILAAQMIKVARDTGLTTLVLEVLTQNVPAIKLYESVSFKTTRRLLGIEIETVSLSSGVPLTESLQTYEVPSGPVINLDTNQVRPTWGRELPTLMTIHTETVIAPTPDGRQNSLVVQHAGKVLIIHYAGLQDDFTNAELSTLLKQAAGDAIKIQVYNEPENSPFLARCRELGFIEFFSQYEMLLTL
jgi:GNAT superfamily N-acetyltransferase